MTALVVDASAVLAWLLPDQATARSRTFEARLGAFELSAPAIFEWEVLNVLTHRRGRRLSDRDYLRAIDSFMALEVAIDDGARAADLLEIAHTQRLSLFDSAYLEAAIGLQAEIASKDKALVAAALRAGLVIHDLMDAPAT